MRTLTNKQMKMDENANLHKVRNITWLVISIIVVVALFAYALSKPASPVDVEEERIEIATPIEPVSEWVTPESPEADWKVYENKRLGFSFSYPPLVKNKNGTSTLAIIDNGKTSHVYLRWAYNFVAGKDYTWEDLEGNVDEMNWRISARAVASEKALTKFVNDVFEGTDCVLDTSTPVDGAEDLMDVTVKASGTNDLDEFGGCPVNYRYIVKYSPKHGRAAAWRIGQDMNFINILSETQGTTTTAVYDETIAKSFRFIK